MTFLQVLLVVLLIANFKSIANFIKHNYKVLLVLLCAIVLFLYIKHRNEQRQDVIVQYEKLVNESK